MSPRSFPADLDPVHNRLDYLDLQGEIKDHFDIKLSVAFEFLKKPGHFCTFPTITTMALSSIHLEPEAEVAAVTIMHDILLNRIAPLVRQRWFCWDAVNLPTKMLQTSPDESSLTPSSKHVQPDHFLLPDPLDLIDAHQSPDDSITSFASESFDLPSLWSDTISSGDSTFPTFGSPNFTSTPLPQPPALPASMASGVLKRHPTRHVQPNETTSRRHHNASASVEHGTQDNTEYRVRILPGNTSPFMIPSRPFILAAKPPPPPPPPRPFVLAKLPPTSPNIHKPVVEPTSSDVTANVVQMKTVMHGLENGVSVTNHIYLVTSDPGSVQLTRDVGYDRICDDIKNALSGLSLHHSTMNEIWSCIRQVEGYKANSWKAILVKLDIPEECHYDVIRIMANASCDRQLGVFCPFGICFRPH
ncbi:hypothetical protein F4604DRAFT_1913947 [Suillus subluteus]|nr:hypothetical protein F4604DRAFT_1913947 [Suillus subluteus]